MPSYKNWLVTDELERNRHKRYVAFQSEAAAIGTCHNTWGQCDVRLQSDVDGGYLVYAKPFIKDGSGEEKQHDDLMLVATITCIDCVPHADHL